MLKQDIGDDITHGKLQPVTREELAIAFSGPTICANRFFVTVVGPMVRIAFCEQLGNMLQFRTAVSLPIQDAADLATALKQILTIPMPAMPQKIIVPHQ